MLNQMKKQFDIIYKRYHLAVLKDLFDRAQIGYVGPTFAYYALLTIFPTIMSVVMLISITNVNHKDMIAVVSSILPQNIQVIVLPILRSVLSSTHLTLLSFSVPFTLWTVSQVLAVFRMSFNRIADVEEHISGLLTRVWSFLWLLLIIAAFGVLMIGSNILAIVVRYIPGSQVQNIIISGSKWFIWLGMFLLLVMLNYFLPTKMGRAPIKWVALGSFIELIMLNLLNVGFTWYAQVGIKQYNFYQSIGSIIVLLIWLNLIGTILVLGYVLIQWFNMINQQADTTKLEESASDL